MYGGLCLYFMNSWERTGSQLTHTHTRTNRQCRRADAKNPHCLLCFVVWPLDTVCSYYVDPMQMLQNCINSNQFLINVSALWIRNYIFEGRLRILIWTIFRFLDYQKYIFDDVLFFLVGFYRCIEVPLFLQVLIDGCDRLIYTKKCNFFRSRIFIKSCF